MRHRSGAALRFALLVVGAGAALPAVALAQSAAEDEATLRDRLDPLTAGAVLRIVDSSAAADLPPHPLFAKALEGAAKHADGPRIVAAVRALAADLGGARARLGHEAEEASLLAAAGALRAGVDPSALTDLRAARGTAVAWPLSVLTDLVSRGVPADTATTVVLSLARSGASDAAFTAFQHRVADDIGAGVPAGVAAVARAPEGRPPASGTRPHPASRPRMPRPEPPRRP